MTYGERVTSTRLSLPEIYTLTSNSDVTSNERMANIPFSEMTYGDSS